MTAPKAAGVDGVIVRRDDLVAARTAINDLCTTLQFALLCTTPDIARDGMKIVERSRAALAALREAAP